MRHRGSLLAAGWLVLWLGACASEGLRLDRQAARLGFDILTLRGGDFHLRAYTRPGRQPTPGDLHLYLEGDGMPWIGGNHVAEDPHGRRTVAFELMRLDPAPVLYLERPCYHRLAADDPCTPALWTNERYSEAVVDSLARALEPVLEARRIERLTLIGYSGGGVLAMLLAERLPVTDTVVTLAANLDVGAWTRHHRYLPLGGSLDPARRPPLAPRIHQLHLAGADDRNVPPGLVRATARAQAAELRVLDGQDHACCWTELWPEILQELESSRPRHAP